MEIQSVITCGGGEGMSVPVEAPTEEGQLSTEHFKVSLFFVASKVSWD